MTCDVTIYNNLSRAEPVQNKNLNNERANKNWTKFLYLFLQKFCNSFLIILTLACGYTLFIGISRGEMSRIPRHVLIVLHAFLLRILNFRQVFLINKRKIREKWKGVKKKEEAEESIKSLPNLWLAPCEEANQNHSNNTKANNYSLISKSAPFSLLMPVGSTPLV